MSWYSRNRREKKFQRETSRGYVRQLQLSWFGAEDLLCARKAADDRYIGEPAAFISGRSARKCEERVAAVTHTANEFNGVDHRLLNVCYTL